MIAAGQADGVGPFSQRTGSGIVLDYDSIGAPSLNLDGPPSGNMECGAEDAAFNQAAIGLTRANWRQAPIGNPAGSCGVCSPIGDHESLPIVGAVP